MSEKTKIQWCDDTHNFWQGCTKVSPGCAHCYAEARDKRFHGASGVTHWGKGALRVRSKDFDAPLRWNKLPWVCPNGHGPYSADEIKDTVPCCECGAMLRRRRVFSLSLGDWLDDEVPIAWLADMLDVIRQCPNLDFLLLTKRPEDFGLQLACALCDYLNVPAVKETWNWIDGWISGDRVPANVWVGVSVENQEQADKRISELLKIPAKVRFLSVEPMLGPVDVTPFEPFCSRGGSDMEGVHWVIVGGESGKDARPCNIEWIRSIVKLCQAVEVPCFVKQVGARCYSEDFTHSHDCDDDGCALAGGVDDCAGEVVINFAGFADPKGGAMAEWPEDLRVREFLNL